MITEKFILSIKSLIIVIILLSNVACATVKDSGKDDSKKVLLDTVKAYYNYKKNGDHDNAFRYERISIKAIQDMKNEYVQRAKRSDAIVIKNFEILSVSDKPIDKEGYITVRVKLTTNWPSVGFPTPEYDRVIEFDDIWQLIDGKWYHVIKGFVKDW